jgi:hypothetical protein
MVFNATFNNISVISWWSVLLVEETRIPWEHHRSVAIHWHPLSHNAVLGTPHYERDSNSQNYWWDTYCIDRCKSNYHTITTTTAPVDKGWHLDDRVGRCVHCNWERVMDTVVIFCFVSCHQRNIYPWCWAK